MSVEQAIQTVLTADEALVDLCTGGIWQGSAPQSQPRPYLAWQLIGGSPEHTFGGKAHDDLLFQFYGWAEDTEGAAGVDTAAAIRDRAETVLADALEPYCRKDRDLPDLTDPESGGEMAYGKGQQWRHVRNPDGA